VAETPKNKMEVQILPPDRSLQQKLGVVTLEKILSPQVVATAQQAIVRASGPLLEESVAEVDRLARTARELGAGADSSKALREILDSAFSLKSKAGLAGYDFISVLAKSLNQYCESCEDGQVTPANISIISWHIQSLRRLLELKIKGSGGPLGEAILTELKKLGVTIASPPRME
jgi:hypothetical protein